MTKARILADYVAGGTTATEFDFMDGVTSNVQTQLTALDTAKAPLASPTFTGTTTVSGDLVPSTPLSNRNMIINGAMAVAQRGTSAVTTHSAFGVDRFSAKHQNDGAFTLQQVSESPAGFAYSSKFTCTTADASLGAGQYFNVNYSVEGQDLIRLALGSSDAKIFTLSFYVRSSLAGTFGGSLRNGDANRSYPFTYTISSVNTWERVSVTIQGDTTGTWVITNAAGMYISFGLGVGATFNGTAGAWAGANLLSSSGTIQSPIGTLNSTWHITGVQLELGSSATPFEHRSYADELARCQRYYYTINAGSAHYPYTAYWAGTGNNRGHADYPCQMRVAPSYAGTNVYGTVPTAEPQKDVCLFHSTGYSSEMGLINFNAEL